MATFQKSLDNCSIDGLCQILEDWEDINEVDNEGRTSLHIVLYSQNRSGEEVLELVKLLVSKGVKVNTRCNRGNTALHHAVHLRNVELILLLLRHGAEVDPVNDQGSSPLHLALSIGFAAGVRALLEHGADLCLTDGRKRSSLHLAVIGKNVELVEAILAKGVVDVNMKNYLKETALTCAFKENLKDIALLLLRSGAEIDCRLRDLQTSVLHRAVAMKDLQLVEALLERKVDLEIKDADRSTALHIASRDFPEAVQLLLKCGAKIDVKDKEENSPLHLLVKGKNTDVLKIVLEHHPDVNSKNKKGQTALHLAAKFDFFEGVLLLISHNASVNETTISGKAPLHYAVSKSKDLGIMKALIQADANVHLEDKKGRTPLFSAINFRKYEMVELFLQNEANVNTRATFGKRIFTPLQLAVYQKNYYFMRTFIEKGARLEVTNEFGQTALHLAAKLNDKRAVELLLDAGADINAQDNNGDTALHVATERKFETICQFLLQRGADITVSNNSQKSPLHKAFSPFKVTFFGKDFDSSFHLPVSSAALDSKDEKGNSLLHYAVLNSGTEGVRRLLETEVVLNDRNNLGETPLLRLVKAMLYPEDFIWERSHMTIHASEFLLVLKLLVRSGADVRIEDNHKCTALDYANKECREEIISILEKTSLSGNEEE